MYLEEKLQVLRDKWKLATVSEREILRIQARALQIAIEQRDGQKKTVGTQIKII